MGVPTHQRWVNDKKFDGGQSTENEKELRDFYKRLLNFTINSEALMGEYAEIHHHNKTNVENYTRKIFSFVRWSKNEKLIIISNFDDMVNYDLDLQIPAEIIKEWNLSDGSYTVIDELYQKVSLPLIVKDGIGTINVELDTLNSFIFKVQK